MTDPHNFPGGWRPRPPDTRDYTIPDLLHRTAPSLHALYAAVATQHSLTAATKAWARAVTDLLEPAPTPPTPAPTPPSPGPDAVVQWSTPAILDQRQTPHCVGFAAAAFLEDSPIEDTGVNDALGDKLYYECKVFDAEPGQENGSDVRSAAKALKARGRIGAYAFAASPAEVVDWVRTKGPVQIGSVWLDGMFSPDAGGYVRPTGAVAGGHSYMAVGHDPIARALIFQNSWGKSFGLGGLFRMTEASFAELWARDAEGLVTVENPL